MCQSTATSLVSLDCFSSCSFQEGIRQVLHAHDVLEPVVSTLEWSNKRYTGLLFFTGIAIYVLNEVVGIGLMMLLGVVAILQLLVYRFLLKLQSHELISKQVNLKESFVVTPEPHTVSVTVKVLGDFLRLTEERVKDIALSRDYVELFEAMLFLFFLSGYDSAVFPVPS